MKPVERITQLPHWSNQLSSIATHPLELCPNFPRIAERFEAWWNHDLLDRPILIAQANPNPARPINRRLDLLPEPDKWFEAKLADVKQLHRVADALPHIRVDFGPVLIGGLLGAAVEFQSDTTWTHAFINDDWSNAPNWTMREDNPWWILLRKLTEMVAQDAAGRYLLCTPDLGGSADVLLNLRGSSELCLDVIDQPERVVESINAIYPTWRRAWSEIYDVAMKHNAGLVHWLLIWSSKPYMIPACDFNYMIRPEDFQKCCLPDIARQAETAGRAVFHLDGPGAARHIDALLEVPQIQAIQFTPGEGTPSALPWIEMFRKIQNKGRSVIIIVRPAEILKLCDELDPKGLAFLVADTMTVDEADALYDQLKRRFSAGS